MNHLVKRSRIVFARRMAALNDLRLSTHFVRRTGASEKLSSGER